jgi:hypothetical protein
MPLEYVRHGAGVVAQYVPGPIVNRAAVEAWVDAFADIERRAFPSTDGSAWTDEAIVAAVAGTASEESWKSHSGTTARCRAAFDLLVRPKSINLADVRAAHGALMGQKPSVFRLKSAWIGATTPLVSTYVAPQAERVPGLIGQAAALMDNAAAGALLQAMVVFVRILHIHAFPDGNGRLARLMGIACLARRGRCFDGLGRLYAAIAKDRGHEWLYEGYCFAQTEDWNQLLKYIHNKFQESNNE